ncbi:phosphatase PAP2 family protein [Variovorax paradoxus]|jgi:membrane-associated phospholipid phosphatase|uniref:phosphatase PAP2 family protein n=1 Tax=Variovorax paradoxus TaxID=34073 RepID=UPI0029C83B59|nr:phosphatase PAP2 family protein [Variovorax paradoxus]WPH20013.1 phosphatase PAP2 family protein [Variovorax paradoxus]
MPMEAPALVLLARQLGEHSLAWFAGVLAASVLGAGVACRALKRWRIRRSSVEEPDEPRLAAGLAIGFLSILGTASLVAYLASKLGDGRLLGLADQALADAVGDHVPWAALVAFSWLTHLGDAELLAPVCLAVALLLWRRAHHGLALGWVMALGGIVLLNPALKRIFARARPLHDHGLALETSFSFPSGHSAGAIVSYGMLLYLALRLLPARWHVPAAMAAAAAIVTIACSRVFLQVHFASDVAAGLLTGLAWLLVCVGSLEYARHRKRRRIRP